MPNAALGMSAGALGALSVGVNVDLRSFNSSMDQVEQRAGRATQTINQMGSSLGSGAAMGAGFAVATAALTALTSAASGAVGAVVGLSSQLEQAQIGFTAFTGSAQKATDFVKQLQDFAAHTTFEFPSLLQASRQLMGMGVQAELVIPIMKDVGAAVMAVGGGDTEIKRVNLAITQMMAAGKVNAQDMNQLAQAGIPAWKMLADSMGVSIGKVRELSKQGQISSAQMLQAFHNFVQNNNLDDMLANANKTWAAASSNFIDGLRNMATEGFAPFFAMARDGLVAVADELTSIDAKNFAQDMKATMQGIVDSLAPVREAISNAFSAFKTDGVSGALQSLLQSAQQMAVNMFGAGVTVVEQFASGIVSGASNAITAAANFVADIIASYLIGNSPPPVGPLSQIAAGGTAVIEAYVEGMKGGLASVTDIAQGVADTLGNVSKSLTLAQGEAAFKAAGNNVKALESGLHDVEGVIRNLDGMIRDNQNTIKDYQNAATDIKDAYEAAIDPLQKQVDALKETNDLAQKQADIQDRIALSRLKGQLAQAQGDPVQRARLQTQLDALEEQDKTLALQEKQLALEKQQSDLRAKQQGKKPDDTGTAARRNQLEQQRLGISMQQNQIQLQLNGMVDKEAVARIKSQQAVVTAAKDQRDINNEVANLNRELQAAPLEQQIKDLKAQEEGLLAPIEERIKQYQREGQELTAQRQQWQGLKSDITDTLQAQRSAAEEAKKAAKEAADASKKAALDNPLDLSAIFKPEAITAQATKVGQSWLTGFKDYLTTNAGAIIGGALGAIAGGSMFGPLGAIAGAAFGAQFTTRLLGAVGGLENLGGLIAGKISDALNIDTGAASNSMEAFGIIFVTLKDRVLTALEELRAGIITKLQGAQGVLSGWQKTWQETFGSETPGAQAGINAIEGLNKALQALQLLMQGDFKGAFDTAKESFATFGKAGEDTVAAVNKFVTDVQAKLQPFIAVIKAEWQTVVDAWNSAKFQDNISIVVANASTALGLMRDIVDKLYISVAPLIDLIKQGAGPTLTWGAAMQDAAAKAAAWTTTLVNLLDAENVYLATLGRIKNELVVTGKAVVEFARLLADTFIHPGDTALAQGHLDIISGLSESFNRENEAIRADWAALIERIKARQADLTKAGQEASAGIAQGVTAGQPQVDAAITKTADDLHSKFTERMQSRSPSQVMLAEGVNVNTGLTQGITDSTTLVIAAITVETDLMLQTYTVGFTALITLETEQLAVMLELLVTSGEQKVQAVNEEMAAMLDASTAGFSAIHAGATQQLDEIYALIVSKGVDMTGAVTNTMAAMLAVIMGEQEKWAAAGTALGSAFAASAMKSMSTASAGANMTMMGNVTGGSKASPALQASINAAAGRHGLNPALFTAQLQHESAGFDPNVLTGARRGGAGEVGIGQFLPSTLRGLGVDIDAYLKDVNLQIETSAKYLSDLVAQYGNIDKALMAYNGGPGGIGSSATQRYAQIVHEIANSLQSGTVSSSGRVPVVQNAMSSSYWSSGGTHGGHPAADIFANIGTPIYSPVSGTSMPAKYELGGEATIIKGEDGKFYYMAHGNVPFTGGYVKAGQQIGQVGNTGNAAGTSPHLHYAIASAMSLFDQLNGSGDITGSSEDWITTNTGMRDPLGAGGMGAMLRGGKMSLPQIAALSSGMSELIDIANRLDAAGIKTFDDLTNVSTKFGAVVNTQVSSVDNDIQQVATSGSDANQKIQDSTQTLAQSIQSGVVPAGLAARGAIGAMSIEVQPLIAQFANGQITADQLGQAIVGLASSTGLTTAPLEAMQAGTLSTNAAMRQVLDSLIAADPAFADIQQSFDATAQTSGDLANVLLQGLSNVTGQVPASLTQLATAAKPLQEAFTQGAISGDDFVKGVVAIAATSGLTQQPLRAMQDGLLTSNEALAAVVTQVASADPALASMATSITDTQQPATDAATAFVAWAESMAQTQQATTDAQTAVEQVPAAVEGIQAPVEEAATTSMQAIPDQANIALDTTIQAINGKSGDFSSAGEALGNALVDGISNVVKESAQKIADDVSAIVKDALEAAKKAADEATANLKSKTKGGGSSSKKDGDQTDSKATGGRLTPGIWTLVGEEGPELISPNGYVYTAAQTLGMVADGMASGLISLEHFASGGKSSTKSKSSSKSKSKKSTGTEAAAKKQQTEPYLEEVNLAQQVMGIEQQRDKLLVEMLPIQEKIRKEQEALEAASKGSLATQLQLNNNKKVTAEIESKIYHLTYDERPLYTSTYRIQLALNEAKRKQEEASKGDLATQQKLTFIETSKLVNNEKIAQIQLESLPMRQRAVALEAQIAELQKGSLADQLKSAAINAEKNKNLLAENAIQIQAAPLRAEIAAHERAVQRILDGTIEQKQTIAQNDLRIAQITQTELQTQRAMLPVQSAIRDVQKEIDRITSGTVDVQKQAVDLSVQQAQLRLQEIDAQGQLRDVEAGTLNLNQQQINDLHKRLEILDAQKGDLNDQSETQQLLATIASADARKRLIDLNAQASVQQDVLDTNGDQKSILQNQNDLIKTGNQVAAAGEQAKLADLQEQLSVYEEQIAGIEAQNSVLDLQLQGIQLQNQIRADGLQSELLTLQNQLSVYDQQIVKVQQQNDVLTAQAAVIQANNAVAAAGYNAQIILMQSILSARQLEIDKLNDQKNLIGAQTTEINNQNTIAAAGHQAQILQLQAQEVTQQSILGDMNAQIGALNAQKKIYQDIRDLADAIANRPVAPRPAPGGTTGGAGGPPGTVAATASKEGAETLYLSRGTGTDGWYTSAGQLVVQGGASNPPSGYKVKWLAEGGILRKGEMAIVGEHGPEPIIAQQDLIVFPNESLGSSSRRSGRPFSGFAGLDDDGDTSNKSITVNLEYHRHGGTDYGEGTLTQIVRESINVALRQ